MPKDFIHFTIAERTSALLASTRFTPCLEQKTDGLLLGSIFHDSLFYAATKAGKPLEALAHELHGADGQDTFTLIKMQAEHTRSASKKSLPAALLVGMVSHLFADAIMHPMVWYFTGNYYAEDPVSKSITRQRHRALESLMDMVACPEKVGQTQYKIRTLMRRCPEFIEKGLPITEIGKMVKMTPKETQKQLTTAWVIFSGFQAAYSITPLARALFALRPYLPTKAAELSCLFYAPQLLTQTKPLSEKIAYRHPVTGQEHKTSLNKMINTAAQSAAEMCRQLEPTVFDNAPLNLLHEGPSMDAGIPGVPTQKMRYYSETPFPQIL